MIMQKQLDAVIDTMTPRKGHGILETIVVLILFLAYVYFIATGTQTPDTYTSAISIIIGYLFGRNEPKD